MNQEVVELRRQGRYKEATEKAIRTLELAGQTLGENHLGYATCLNTPAGLHRALGRYGEAEPLCRRSLAI